MKTHNGTDMSFPVAIETHTDQSVPVTNREVTLKLVELLNVVEEWVQERSGAVMQKGRDEARDEVLATAGVDAARMLLTDACETLGIDSHCLLVAGRDSCHVELQTDGSVLVHATVRPLEPLGWKMGTVDATRLCTTALEIVEAVETGRKFKLTR